MYKKIFFLTSYQPTCRPLNRERKSAACGLAVVIIQTFNHLHTNKHLSWMFMSLTAQTASGLRVESIAACCASDMMTFPHISWSESTLATSDWGSDPCKHFPVLPCRQRDDLKGSCWSHTRRFWSVCTHVSLRQIPRFKLIHRMKNAQDDIVLLDNKPIHHCLGLSVAYIIRTWKFEILIFKCQRDQMCWEIIMINSGTALKPNMKLWRDVNHHKLNTEGRYFSVVNNESMADCDSKSKSHESKTFTSTESCFNLCLMNSNSSWDSFMSFIYSKIWNLTAPSYGPSICLLLDVYFSVFFGYFV